MTCEALVSLGHHVDVVRTELAESTTGADHHFPTSPIRWEDSSAVARATQRADYSVFHIGNFYGFHAGAIEWLQKHPGIVCLHDIFLGGLFLEWAASHRSEAELVLQRLYGPTAAELFWLAAQRPDFIELTSSHTPLTEWIASKATGVLSHSAWGLEPVLRSCAGPVAVAQLPYDLRAPALAEQPGLDGRVQILTFGHINQNKRVGDVIDAIGRQATVAEQCVYRIVGPVAESYRKELLARATARGVSIEIAGPADDAQLSLALSMAQIVVALRWPCLEAASASTIEAMLAGKPTIVFRDGWYADLPDEVVRKVDRKSDTALTAAIAELVSDQHLRLEIGLRAAERARRVYRADAYAHAIVEVSRAALRADPKQRVVDDIVRRLSEWGGSADIGHQFHFGPLTPFFEIEPKE
jgi:glycosyltransferase involved in cell wall biosynthesis